MISVIVPVYNEEKDIEQCLNSLDGQKGTNFETIVVDDGSTDSTPKILKRFKPKNYSLMTLKQNHNGAGAARNKAANKAKGDILVFVDADMTFEKDFIKNLTKPIVLGNAKGTSSQEEYVANWDNIWARCWNYNDNREDKMTHPKKARFEGKVFRAILKREFNRVGGFKPGGYTDDWSLAKKLGYESSSAENAVYYHKNPSSLQEVYKHAQWVGKREYKLWTIGAKIALLRASLPLTIIVGIIKAIKYKELRFLVFKFVYNTGLTIGIVKYMVGLGGQK